MNLTLQSGKKRMKDWKVEEEIEINLVGKKTEKRKNKQIHDAGIKTISEHRWQPSYGGVQNAVIMVISQIGRVLYGI